jgi:hypothetical protein
MRFLEQTDRDHADHSECDHVDYIPGDGIVRPTATSRRRAIGMHRPRRNGRPRICQVHTATSRYTLDVSFPVDYPDQRALTAVLTKQRDQFIDLVDQRPDRDTPYALAITRTAYRSGESASGTESLVFEEYVESGGAHPETYYESLNYDLGGGAPITFDTLFKPGTNPLEVLDPIVQRELANRVGGQADDNPVGATAYQNFAITDDAVTFFIGQGMWIMEAAGPQEVPVPGSDLAAVLA